LNPYFTTIGNSGSIGICWGVVKRRAYRKGERIPIFKITGTEKDSLGKTKMSRRKKEGRTEGGVIF